MKWAEPWSLCSPWGLGTGTGPKVFCALADERVLIQMDDDTSNRKFRDLICLFVEDLGHYSDVCQDVALGFNVDTATGQQLDYIGGVVGLPRQGFADIRYRVFLKIQIDLILTALREGANWTGTHNNILKICRDFVGPAWAPITLTNLPPYSFALDVPGLVLAELLILIHFLCVALYAGVLGQVTFVLNSDSLWNSDSVVVADGGVWCSDSVPVVPCATWSLTVPIGSDC